MVKQRSERFRRHRDELTGEHSFADAGQLLLFLLFLAVWITDTFFFNYSSFPNDYVPLAARLTLGVIMLVTSGYLAYDGLSRLFGEVREKPEVIRRGVFGIVRHPVYLSEILLYLGLIFFSISLAAIAVWIAGIAFMHYISRYEERLLLAKFGEEYEQYMKDVPMYFPRIRRKKTHQKT